MTILPETCSTMITEDRVYHTSSAGFPDSHLRNVPACRHANYVEPLKDLCERAFSKSLVFCVLVNNTSDIINLVLSDAGFQILFVCIEHRKEWS